MKNKFIKLISLIISLSILFSFTACGGDSNFGEVDTSGTAEGDANTIDIYYWKSGLGLDFMNNMVDAFNKQNNGYKAVLKYDTDASRIINSLSNGNKNEYDLYFTTLNSSTYDNGFITLDDVLDSKYGTETKTLREKYYSYLLDGVISSDGTTKFLTFGNGWCGIICNKDYVDLSKTTLNTTDELKVWTAEFQGEYQIGGNDVKPWIFYNSSETNGYVNYILSVWATQYDGLDYRNNTFFQLKDSNGNSPSKEVLTAKDGRYEAIKVAESLFTPTTVHRNCISTDFTTVQANFVLGEAGMMVNGNWMVNESSKSVTDPDKFEMIKAPIISSIVNTFEGADNGMADSKLSKIISAIDEGKTYAQCNSGETACLESTFNRIKEARGYMFNNAAQQYVFIPSYSPAITAAKEFLKFFYSEEGCTIFTDATGLPSSVRSNYDTSKLNTWGKTQFELCDKMTAITAQKNISKIFVNYSLNEFCGLGIVQPLIASNLADRKTADQLWAQLESKVALYWDDWNR